MAVDREYRKFLNVLLSFTPYVCVCGFELYVKTTKKEAEYLWQKSGYGLEYSVEIDGDSKIMYIHGPKN